MSHTLSVLILGAQRALPAAAARANGAPRVFDAAQDPWGYWRSGTNPEALERPGKPMADRLEALSTCADFSAPTFCQAGYGWQWSGLRQPNTAITFRAWSNLFDVPRA